MATYLVQPKGIGYSFRLAIPQDLRGRFPSRSGKPLRQIVEGLGTDSLKEAQRLAGTRLIHWQSVFDRARRDVPFTLAEIQDAAVECYRTALARLASDAMVMADLIGSEREWLQSLVRIAGQALASDNFKLATADLEAIERRHGVTIEPGSPTYAALARAILRAQIAAAEGRLRLLDGKPSDMPATFLGADGIDPTTLKPVALQRPVTRLKTEHGPWALFEQWVAEAKPAAATINRWRAVFLNLQAKFGANEITESEARLWAKELITPERSPDTVAGIWVSSARRIYKWAIEQKLATDNPFANVRITVPDKPVLRSKAFTPQEATAILGAAAAIKPDGNTFKGAQRWCSWLAAYSGARMGEIAQLRGQDIQQVNGAWIMKLTPEAGTTKTGIFRDVPLHEHIIAQGFLDFVKARGDGPLFYNATADKSGEIVRPVRHSESRTASKGRMVELDATNPARPRAVKTRERLAAWVRELGITDKGISPNHAWRHTFKSVAASKTVMMPDNISDTITGHALATVAGRYVHFEIDDLAAALAKFPRYPV